jgi:hypothetical protein
MDEGRPAQPKPGRLWLVAVAAGGVALVAWAVREAVESANIPHDTGRQWPAFWATAAVGLAVVLFLANRPRPTSRRALATTATAGTVFAATLVVVGFVGLSTASCSLSPDSATWNSKLLHELLREGDQHQGNPLTVAAPPSGFPFRDADLDSRWSRYSMVHVAWGRGIGYDFGPTALMAEPGIVRAAYLDQADFLHHQEEVLGFLQGFGATSGEARRIAQAMEANATGPEGAWPGWGYAQFMEFRAAIPLGWTPRQAWDSFCCIGQQPADDASHASGLGFVDLRVGHWSFGFALETKRMEGDGFLLSTDTEGRVSFEGLSTGREDVDECKGKVKRTLKALALPEPERDAMSVGGSIC